MEYAAAILLTEWMAFLPWYFFPSLLMESVKGIALSFTLDLYFCILLNVDNSPQLKMLPFVERRVTSLGFVYDLVSLGHDYSHDCFITMTPCSF